MTNSADTQQQNDLTELYASYGMSELNSLALTYNDLTDSAQQALRAEYARRGLGMPQPAPVPAERVADESASALHGFAANASEDCVFEFAAMEDALLAQGLLESAGIPSVVPTSEIVAIDTPRLIVSPSDAQAAHLILSRPDASGDAEAAIFTESTCPECGAADPVLEAVDPTNHWHCEACNHRWQDTEL